MKQNLFFLVVFLGVSAILFGAWFWRREQAALALVAVGTDELDQLDLQELPSDFDDSPSATTSAIVSPVPIDGGGCQRAGCSSQLCLTSEQASNLGVTTCEYLPHYSCYKLTNCERQSSGQCGFTPTQEFNTCLVENGAPTPLPMKLDVFTND